MCWQVLANVNISYKVKRQHCTVLRILHCVVNLNPKSNTSVKIKNAFLTIISNLRRRLLCLVIILMACFTSEAKDVILFCVCSLISCIAISRFASLDVRWCFGFNIPSRANHLKGIMPGAFTLILFLTKFQLVMSRG